MTKHPKEADRLRKIVEGFPTVTVTVLGDLVEDEFTIGEIRPDVQAKGTDYTTDSVPERDAVLSYGGSVEIVGDAKNHSTSEIIRSRLSRRRS